MSAADLEVMRRLYEAWMAGDGDRVYATFDPEIELHLVGEANWVGLDPVYRGIEGIQRYFRLLLESFDYYEPRLEQLIDAGDHVVALTVETARGKAGTAVEARNTAHVWTLRGGRPVRVAVYWDRDRALADAGVPPSEPSG